MVLPFERVGIRVAIAVGVGHFVFLDLFSVWIEIEDVIVLCRLGVENFVLAVGLTLLTVLSGESVGLRGDEEVLFVVGRWIV